MGIGSWVIKKLYVFFASGSKAGCIFQVMMEAAIGISVFFNDGASYDQAMTKFLGRVSAYVYLTSDGTYPKAAPGSGLTTPSQIKAYWSNQQTYPENGIAQETCRDFQHTGFGIASIGHVAETSRIQGTDLYTGDIGTRLRYAPGFHSKLELGNPLPSWLCNGSVKKGLGPSKLGNLFTFLLYPPPPCSPFIFRTKGGQKRCT